MLENKAAIMAKVKKEITAMRYWLLANKWHRAHDALELLLETSTGTRKDKITPEYHHPLSVAHYVRTLCDSLLYPEDTIIACILHDSPEDHDLEIDYLKGRFGERPITSVWRATKKWHGVKKSLPSYYAEMSEDPITPIVKGGDRNHNMKTMINVFTDNGQAWYIEETQDHILPMLKKARRKFPAQEPAFENIKHMLLCQIEPIQAYLEVKGQQ